MSRNFCGHLFFFFFFNNFIFILLLFLHLPTDHVWNLLVAQLFTFFFLSVFSPT